MSDRSPARAEAGHTGAARTEVERTEAEREVWDALRDYVDSQGRKRQLRQRPSLGIGYSGVKVLMFLLRNGSRSLGQIAEAHGVDAPYATTLVNKLTGAGLTDRVEDPVDRRRKLVSLTEEGCAVARTAYEILTTPPSGMAALDEAELAELGRLVAKVRAFGTPA